MCEKPNWDQVLMNAADDLLANLMEKRQQITSLDFKQELRQRMASAGLACTIIQADVSRFLRASFEDRLGAFRLAYNSDASAGYIRYVPLENRRLEAGGKKTTTATASAEPPRQTKLLPSLLHGVADGLIKKSKENQFNLTALEEEFWRRRAEMLTKALETAGQNKTEAAKLLGITRDRLYSLMYAGKDKERAK